MSHDAEFVQRGLSVEQHNVSVNEVPLNRVTNLGKKERENVVHTAFLEITNYGVW